MEEVLSVEYTVALGDDTKSSKAEVPVKPWTQPVRTKGMRMISDVHEPLR